jgi:hypothetical protein
MTTQDKNTFRPAPFRHGEEGEPLGGGETERNGSGTGKSDNSKWERARERAVAFAADFRARGYAAFADPRHSAVAICIALTGDWKSLARWMQFERELPRCELKQELADFHRSLADAPVRDRKSALNSRLSKLGRKLYGRAI